MFTKTIVFKHVLPLFLYPTSNVSDYRSTEGVFRVTRGSEIYRRCTVIEYLDIRAGKMKLS